MEQIYDKKLWGGNDTDFYSGEGSHDPKIINPYIAAVISFLKSLKQPIIVCDLGCGDFNVGKQFVPYTEKYIAVDIVEKLIKRNRVLFKNKKVEFKCLDIAIDDLPQAECVIIRQVLQHLSNQEILKILRKLVTYTYIILTEHIPNEKFIPNKDIISGQGIRLKKNSGVNLLSAPFHLNVKSYQELDRTVLPNKRGIIITILYKL